MKTKLTLSALIIFSFLLMAFTTNSSDDEKKHVFIGVKKCGMCHKKDAKGNQLKKWKESSHAKAFKDLSSKKGLEYAKAAGVEGKAEESDACLSCHSTGHGAAAELFDKKFDVSKGVQCEACHGAGKDYKSKKTMEDKAKSMKMGLADLSDKKVVEATCAKCHNGEGPHETKEFVLDERLKEIYHGTK